MPEPGTTARPTDAEPPPEDALGPELVALQPRVRAFVANLRRGSDAAPPVEDVVQEALARAWRSRRTFDAARGDAAAWLLRIAFHAWLDARRRDGGAAALDREQRDPDPGPAERAGARDHASALLATLSERERDVLLRFHRDGETIATIATALGAAEGTVKSLLHRARARLWAIERGDANAANGSKP